MATALERASKGKGYLDGYLGEDWVQYVNLDTLEMANPDLCLLGQLATKHPRLREQCEYGSYHYALHALEKGHTWAQERGFEAEGDCTAPSQSEGCTCGPQYAELEAAWRELLAA